MKKSDMPRLNLTVTDETVTILKEMAAEYGSTMGAMVVMLAKDWKKQKQALAITDISDKMADVMKMLQDKQAEE